ncbi:MAG: hypothetical protein IT489_03850 [Gammaproteobacteria bacterium]|nr:hypothetical protein [Gammaproteobacteria bacterium]
MRIKIGSNIACISLLLFLSGCATPYKTSGLGGGYSEGWLAYNVAYVNFQGNGYTDRQRANDFARLRAAELAIENDYEYVAFTNAESGGYSTNIQMPTYATTTATVTQFGNTSTVHSNTTVTGGQSLPAFFPSSSLVAVYMNYKDDYPELKAIPSELLFDTIKGNYGLTKPVIQEIKSRPKKAAGIYVDGIIYSDNSDYKSAMKIELGKRSGELQLVLNDEEYRGEWRLISRGDSIADIAGEVISASGKKAFARMDVIPGMKPSGIGMVITDMGEELKLKF